MINQCVRLISQCALETIEPTFDAQPPLKIASVVGITRGFPIGFDHVFPGIDATVISDIRIDL